MTIHHSLAGFDCYNAGFVPALRKDGSGPLRVGYSIGFSST